MGAQGILKGDLDRSRALFGTRPVRALGDHRYLIEGSANDPATGKRVVYTVDTHEGTCTCPRFERKIGWQDLACKHLGFLWAAEDILKGKN